MAQEPELRVPKSLFVAPLPDSVKDEGLRESWDKMRMTIMQLAEYVHTDVTLGHCRYPVYASAYVSNIMEGGLGMENDGTREHGWCRINDNLHPITNHPQDFVSYAGFLPNNGTGAVIWTFPQGGFANASIMVLGTLEGAPAHMQADGCLHHLWHLVPTATTVVFYIDEWYEVDPWPAPGPRRIACTNVGVGINAFAIGPPK